MTMVTIIETKMTLISVVSRITISFLRFHNTNRLCYGINFIEPNSGIERENRIKLYINFQKPINQYL